MLNSFWCGLLFASSVSQAATVTLRGADIARSLEQALEQTQLHLDDDVVSRDGSHIQRSFVEVGASLGGGRHFFGMPNPVIDLGSAGKIEYRLRDVNLTSISVRAFEGEYIVSLFFEDEGIELVAKSQGQSNRLGIGAPDFHLNRARLDVTCVPAQGPVSAAGERSAFDCTKVKLLADVRPAGTGTAMKVSARLFESAGLEAMVLRHIERELSKELQERQVGHAASRWLWRHVEKPGVAQLVGASFSGTDLALRFSVASAASPR
jgi:hypothetical protein